MFDPKDVFVIIWEIIEMIHIYIFTMDSEITHIYIYIHTLYNYIYICKGMKIYASYMLGTNLHIIF